MKKQLSTKIKLLKKLVDFKKEKYNPILSIKIKESKQ